MSDYLSKKSAIALYEAICLDAERGRRGWKDRSGEKGRPNTMAAVEKALQLEPSLISSMPAAIGELMGEGWVRKKEVEYFGPERFDEIEEVLPTEGTSRSRKGKEVLRPISNVPRHVLPSPSILSPAVHQVANNFAGRVDSVSAPADDAGGRAYSRKDVHAEDVRPAPIDSDAMDIDYPSGEREVHGEVSEDPVESDEDMFSEIAARVGDDTDLYIFRRIAALIRTARKEVLVVAGRLHDEGNKFALRSAADKLTDGILLAEACDIMVTKF